ncbi:hypothetical protein COT97_00030 [Candidatus Falkowbacteria bacterium CG10_big_fil_rev_8_21_14_0_10_39_11]|uniref:Dephospho-CoA kinase n=1 Tax=Candidatus Falkowbacteria bacterium CG10_big_fil_rev_8_21_14_0_10_39_11 TaxID=1974565 RepID=A0A2H0V695_9BACT|nr:MAG: hypothetical protein COT97_00030 [Candidatus Falkowbacteria bacterium CG10_big_fil_rev_8_21_14_0_10_39_11]
MKTIVTTIGLPFSGKSRLAKEYQDKGFTVISRDDELKKIIDSSRFKKQVERDLAILESPTSRDVFAVKNKVAIEILNERLNDLVEHSDSQKIFYDATNLQRATRQGVINLKSDEVKVQALYLRTPLEVIIQRAIKSHESGERVGQFNEGALQGLQRMYQMLEEPTPDEGFDKFTIIDFKQEQDHEIKIPVK